MFPLELDLRPWGLALGELAGALDDELERAVAEGARVVAYAARRDHPYTDRSETLTRSIRAYAPRGRALRDTLRAEVVARAPYASFVDRRRAFAFLGPAVERSDARIEHHAEDALEAAVRRAGLR